MVCDRKKQWVCVHEWPWLYVNKTLFKKTNGGPDQDHEPHLASLCFKAIIKLLSRGIIHVTVLEDMKGCGWHRTQHTACTQLGTVSITTNIVTPPFCVVTGSPALTPWKEATQLRPLLCQRSDSTLQYMKKFLETNPKGGPTVCQVPALMISVLKI